MVLWLWNILIMKKLFFFTLVQLQPQNEVRQDFHFGMGQIFRQSHSGVVFTLTKVKVVSNGTKNWGSLTKRTTTVPSVWTLLLLLRRHLTRHQRYRRRPPHQWLRPLIPELRPQVRKVTRMLKSLKVCWDKRTSVELLLLSPVKQQQHQQQVFVNHNSILLNPHVLIKKCEPR